MTYKISSASAIDNDKDLGWGLKVVDLQGKQSLFKFVISNQQNCCEKWGAEIFPEEQTLPFEELIGKTIICFKFDDKHLDQYRKRKGDDYDEGGSCFARLVLEDNKCILFRVWNRHEGYYPHRVTLINQDGEDNSTI